MMLSRRNLPAAGVNALALLLNSRAHLPCRVTVESAGELSRARAAFARPRRSGE